MAGEIGYTTFIRDIKELKGILFSNDPDQLIGFDSVTDLLQKNLIRAYYTDETKWATCLISMVMLKDEQLFNDTVYRILSRELNKITITG